MRNLILVFYCFFIHLAAFSQGSQVDTLMSAWSIDLDDVVVTAQYAPTDSRSAVHRVRTIKEEDIRRRGAINLEQLLSQELNIRISQDMILGSSLNLQGVSGQNVQVMVDGIPLIGRIGDDIDLGQVNLNNIERVEIVDGPLSVNYGTNALGGVINLITKKSQLHRFDTQVKTHVENVGRINLNAALGIRPIQKILLKFQGGHTNFKGYNPSSLELEETDERTFLWNPKEQYFAGASLRYDFAKDQQLRYAINWFDENITNLGEVRRPQFKPYSFDDYYHTLRTDYSLHQEGSLGRNYYLNTTIGYNYFKREKNTYRLDFDENIETEVDNQQDTSRFNAFVFRPVLASKFSEGKLNFQLGADIHYENGYGERIKDETSGKENFSELGDYALFGSIQYQLNDNIMLQVGIRAAHNTRFKAPLIPSLNMKYSPSKKLALRASYAKGFRSPSLKELFFYFVDANHFILGNTDLKAEISNNFQLTLDWETTINKNKFGLSATAFYNDIQQKIDLYQYVEIDGKLVPATEMDQASTHYAYFNQYRYKTLGGNLRLSYQFNDLDVKIGGSPIGRYNLLSESADDVSPFTFVLETSAEISYRFPKQDLQLLLYLRYNDKLIRYYQDYDEDNNPITEQSIQDGFMMSDATLSKYLFEKKIQLTAGVKNLLDVQNVSLSGGSSSVHGGSGGSVPMGVGRTWFVGLAWNFGW